MNWFTKVGDRPDTWTIHAHVPNAFFPQVVHRLRCGVRPTTEFLVQTTRNEMVAFRIRLVVKVAITALKQDDIAWTKLAIVLLPFFDMRHEYER